MASRHGGSNRIFWGLMLIVLGTLLLLDRMGELDFGDVIGRFWPVLFILIGLAILINSRFRDAGSGLFFILFGAVFLLFELDILDHDAWRYAWPLGIIAVGFWILFRPGPRAAKDEAPPAKPESESAAGGPGAPQIKG